MVEPNGSPYRCGGEPKVARRCQLRADSSAAKGKGEIDKPFDTYNNTYRAISGRGDDANELQRQNHNDWLIRSNSPG